MRFGPTFYYSPNFLNTGADGEYLSWHRQVHRAGHHGAGRRTIGWYVSGEFGHQWLGTSDSFYGVVGPRLRPPMQRYSADYNTWNVGIGFTWKVFTLDLRYSDTDLSQG